jgi:hypothetical protein
MRSLINKYWLRQQRAVLNSKLPPEYAVDWVNFCPTTPVVRWWVRVREGLKRVGGVGVFTLLIAGLTYALVISAEYSANRKYCESLQDGSIKIVESWHPRCEVNR